MHAIVKPGLYQVGQPDANAPVLVSANYRLSFDRLRSALSGQNIWILVIDTKGINVWCAAGKGTFGTTEVVKRVQVCSLSEVVKHRRLILPQLGAPGVAAHEVTAQTGFQVDYGPVRASDLPYYLEHGKATLEMRQVTFTLSERLAVAPVEWVGGFWLMLGAGVAVGLLSEWRAGAGFLGIVMAAPFAVAAFHNVLPSRLLSVKGAVWGLLAGAATTVGFGFSWKAAMPVILLATVLSAFVGINFTGSTTYTSVNGVRREMRLTIPWMAAGAVVGVVWLVLLKFFPGVLS
jgi:hypothetical protein